MRAYFARILLLACALLALPATGHAQEATLTGTVTDSTGGVLPGVVIVAVHEATGNRFEVVTDERGIYRIPARVGAYRITAELPGFETVTRTGVQLLVGQTGTVNLQMAPSTVEVTVTVTAEAPLLETTTSSLGGNIDPRQVQELPVEGRNWMALALLAPGNRSMETGTQPIPDRGEVREFQLNMDGQQVTSNLGTGGQARYSQDAIAEFQFISNRFDASQGRSFGVQVNAVTKSGTNRLTGTFRSNFRDDRFNADDPIVGKEPGSNQQLSGTLGGPILRDKLHFFGNYEYERNPRTSIWNTPFPAFNISLSGNRTVKLGGGRLDYQFSPSMRLMGKYSQGVLSEPFGAGTNNNHPAATNDTSEDNKDLLGQFTQVLSNRAVNEVKAGYSEFSLANANLTTWSNHWQAQTLGVTQGGPRIQFTGFNITGNQNHPRNREQQVYVVRDDFTFSYTARGRHDLRVGGEFLYDDENTVNCQRCGGLIDARRGPAPANIETLFPDWRNADTWNLAALSPLTRRYLLGIGTFPVEYNHKKSA
ncbi:MAG: carboxypeptidase regulatory-like domain-containing protein, partial [Acidobacteria bacterium]|nr:carboxypeptidase regulatory-like domain-containing protein [Acidobacteriota bacterium]